MVKTASTMLELGTTAPNFSLPNIDEQTVSLADFADAPALVVCFMCNHCPFVKHLADHLAEFVAEMQLKNVAFVGISSNDVEKYPQDSLEEMKKEAELRGYTFPYLLDESQQVAKAYRAACTPDFFLFDSSKKLVYRGQYDPSRPDSGVPITGDDLRTAIEAVLANQPVSQDQKPSIGCNIKWKEGSEPTYFKPQGIGG